MPEKKENKEWGYAETEQTPEANSQGSAELLWKCLLPPHNLPTCR